MSGALPRCLSCARLEWHGRYYSCPQNRRFNPHKQSPHFAEKCALYVPGQPTGQAKRIYFSACFNVELGGSGRTLYVTAGEGWTLKILPESTPQKVVIVAVKTEGGA
jgi:hypothetical protein